MRKLLKKNQFSQMLAKLIYINTFKKFIGLVAISISIGGGER